MPQKIIRDEYLIVSPDESWLHNRISKNFYDDDFYRIIDFYVLHSPCKILSYSPRSLESMGWRNPWNSKRFRDAFDSIPGFVVDETFFHHNSTNHFLGMWEDSGFVFPPTIGLKEFAVLIYAGESNPRMDLMHHIRNAFAHGRFSASKVNKEFYIFFEDVTTLKGLKSDLVVNARICLKKNTLIEWLNIFEQTSEKADHLSSLHN